MQRLLIASCAMALAISCRAPEPAPASQKHTRPLTTQGTFQDAQTRAHKAIETSRLLSIPTRPLAPNVIRGVAIPLYNEFPNLSFEEMTVRAAKVGATHVSFPVMWRQRTIFHNRIERSEAHTPPDAKIRSITEAAKKAGLKVMLFPIVHIERRSKGEWRGKMAPTDLEAWKQDYREFILHYADLAEKNQVATLSVGSELSSMEGETKFWARLIKDVRSRFRGKLIYSANWDHYDKVPFWSQLDYVGVSSYFEVAKRTDDPVYVIADRWRLHRQAMLKHAASVDRPLIMTEVGYPSVDSSTVKPWDYTTKSLPNHNAQLAGFRALVEAFSEPDPHFGGLFIWHGWGYGGSHDTSYAFWGKPTEGLLRRWFAR